MDVKPFEEPQFEEFVRARGDELLRLARRFFPDPGDAEDALQTALLRLVSHWPKEHPTGYVRTTLINLAKDAARRRHLVPEPVAEVPEPPNLEHDHGDEYVNAVTAQRRLDALLSALPRRQRVTVVLRLLEGYSEADTAAALGCSTGTVKSNLARGLDKVRNELSSALMQEEEAR